MIIAVDFDGFLCEDRYPEIGPPILKNIELVNYLMKENTIILWTCRKNEELEKAIEYCKNFDITFDYINENVPSIIKKYGGDSRKIYADIYLDDRNCIVENKTLSKKIYSNICDVKAYLYGNPCIKSKDPFIEYEDPLDPLKRSNFIYDQVDKPSHYTKDRKFQPAWCINDWKLNFDLGNCVKYIARLGRKDDTNKDIKKAFWYLTHEILLNHKDISKEELINTINYIDSEEQHG